MLRELQIDKLKKKRQEIKNDYEIAREKRIDIVNSMQELDDKIDELTKTIEESKENLKDNHSNKLGVKKILNSYLITFISQWGITILFNTIINTYVVGKFAIAPISIITSGIVIALINTIQYKINHKIDKSDKKKKKKIKPRDLENLKNERTILIEQRLSLGTEYKRAREEEVLREKIYKKIDPIIAIEITRILEGENTQQTKQEISTKDIYYKIKLDPTFDSETIDNKKIILDNELKKYLSQKISEVYYYAIDYQDLEFLSAEELAQMLINEIPKEKHKEIFSNIIHAILNFSGYLQGYGVVWFEEDDEQLIDEPELVFDEDGKFTELKTHKNTNYEMLFNIVYDVFINNIKQTKHKSRIKEEK